MTVLAEAAAPVVSPACAMGVTGWSLVCPQCRGALEPSASGLRCGTHGELPLEGGVWRMLTAERAARYRRFLHEYGTIRRAEGRGGDDPAWYRALPFEDRSGTLSDQWRIRAGSYRALLARVVEPLERERGRPLDVVDVGAGNGWLSYRLAQRGHRALALDLGDDERDGLGAHGRYADGGPSPFTPVQADFDRLPLADGCADLVVFNASLHYATDIADTLAEAARVVRADGRVIVLDSPVYRAAESGRRMVVEREASFRERYGFPSNALASESWFTAERLTEAGAGAGLAWTVHLPWHGVRWALRPWIARARRRREPSSFWLLEGRVAPAAPAAPTRRTGVRAELLRSWLRTRHRLRDRPRAGRTVRETVAGVPLSVHPGVFNPRIFRTGAYLAGFVAQGVVTRGSAVLELGTGSGAVALAAAGAAGRVVAVDLSADAVRCAAENARANGLAERVDVREGDLFGPLRADERFDLVLFNPPFYRGQPRDVPDAAWRSVDVPERFARELPAHLTPRGRALVVLSSDCDVDGWLAPCRARGLAVRLLASRDLGNEVLVIYRIAPRAGGAPAGEGRVP